ncbi:phage DNA packaging protein J [Phaeobacter sp. NW0010-22]
MCARHCQRPGRPQRCRPTRLIQKSTRFWNVWCKN